MSCKIVISLLLLLGFIHIFPSAAYPLDLAESDDDTTAAHPAEACQALFIPSGENRREAQAHQKKLLRIKDTRKIVTLIHRSNAWTKPPVHAHTESLSVVDIATNADGRHVALIEVPEDLAEKVDCEPGLYRIDRNDELLPGTDVLAISEDFILIDHNGQLAYLTPGGPRHVTFRMVWQSPWSVKRETATSQSSSRKKKRRGRRRGRRR